MCIRKPVLSRKLSAGTRFLRSLFSLLSIEIGAESVETGLVTSCVVGPLLFGLIAAGQVYNTYGTMKQAARAGARVALVRSCATCGNALPAVSDVEGAVTSTLQAASLSPSQITIPTCPGNLSKVVCYQQEVALNPGDSLVENGAIVSFTYPVTLTVPFTPVQVAKFNVTTHVQMRAED